MKKEINCAAQFVVNLIQINCPKGHQAICSTIQLESFKDSLVDVLCLRYNDHWFPEKPLKGSAYRCIRVNGKLDPVIAEAANSSGLTKDDVHALFPSELTLWIDPADVSYRIGENGSVCSLLNGVSASESSASLTDCKSEYLQEESDFDIPHQLQALVSS